MKRLLEFIEFASENGLSDFNNLPFKEFREIFLFEEVHFKHLMKKYKKSNIVSSSLLGVDFLFKKVENGHLFVLLYNEKQLVGLQCSTLDGVGIIPCLLQGLLLAIHEKDKIEDFSVPLFEDALILLKEYFCSRIEVEALLECMEEEKLDSIPNNTKEYREKFMEVVGKSRKKAEKIITSFHNLNMLGFLDVPPYGKKESQSKSNSSHKDIGLETIKIPRD